jgi:chromosome segregation ATPase
MFSFHISIGRQGHEKFEKKVLNALSEIQQALEDLKRKEVIEIMGIQELKDNVNGLIEEVAAVKTVQESAVVAFNGVTAQLDTLNKQLADAIANGDPVAIQAAADAIAANTQVLKDSTAQLAAAIPAGTA